MAKKYCCKKTSGNFGDCQKSEYDSLSNEDRKIIIDDSACGGSSTNTITSGNTNSVTTGGGGKLRDANGEGDVEDLQNLLKKNGYDIGSTGVDDVFGPYTLYATLKALREFLPEV